MKRHRISLIVITLLPILFIAAGLGIGSFFIGYSQAKQADYNVAVSNDEKSMFSLTVSAGHEPETLVPKLRELYQANPRDSFPTDQAEANAYYGQFRDIYEFEEYSELNAAFPSKIATEILDYNLIGFLDEERARFVVLLTKGDPSLRMPYLAGYFFDVDVAVFQESNTFYGASFYDSVRGTKYFTSGIASMKKNEDGKPMFWVLRQTNEATIYRASSKFRDNYLLLISVTFVGVALTNFIVIFFIVLRPIKKLSKSSDKYVDGLHDGKIVDAFEQNKSPVETEIGTLNDSLFYMQDAIGDYTNQVAEAAKKEQQIATELSLAERIQSGMVPSAPLVTPSVECFGFMVPAKEVGGDFYDFFPVDENHIGIVIGDVSGKGVPAALFMARAHTVAKLLLGSHDIDRINKTLCQENGELLFVTAFFALFDTKKRTLHYVNCGHEQAYIRHDGKFSPLDQDPNMPLGLDDTFPFVQQETTLSAGDALFLYTDGLSEATDSKGALFGRMGIDAPLNECASERGDGLLKTLWSKVQEFVGDAPQSDDACMVICEIK